MIRINSTTLGVISVLAISAWVGPALAQEGRWFRGNLHTHSLWSDGNDFPEMICDWYARHDYHFLALSDHNILSEGTKWIDESVLAKRGATGAIERCRDRFGADWMETRQKDETLQIRLKSLREFRGLVERPGKFLLLQGEEITDSFESLPIHINATNLEEVIRPRGGTSVRDAMKNNFLAVAEQSARIGRPIIAHLNHPNYGYAITAEDMADVVQERFFEIYNGHPSVNQPGDTQHASLERLWDIANTLRVSTMKSPPLYGIATDDSHAYFGERGATPGRGWILVRAAELTGTRLIEAINGGHFYASSGVELASLNIDESAGRLELKIVPRPGASYVTEFLGTRNDFDGKSEPVVDPNGQELRATRIYSADVGQVLAKVEGTVATYALAGDELYVRARITSSEAPENPSFEHQRRQAWTQPFGWRRWIQPVKSAAPSPR